MNSTPASFRDLRLVTVAELPGFHNPFRCDRAELFQAHVDAARRSRRRREVMRLRHASVAELTFEEGAAIMTAARRRISVDEVRDCRYHRSDWVRVAAQACELVVDRGERLTDDDVSAAGKALSKSDAFWLWSLFDDPIAWDPDAATLTNGQHRACGLWFSGAERVPVAPAHPAR